MVIEDAFLAHPAVAACAAVAEPDRQAGELPVCYVTLKPGACATAGTLLEAVGPRIAERPAVPKRVTVLEQLPQTTVGKPYEPALRVHAAERTPAGRRSDWESLGIRMRHRVHLEQRRASCDASRTAQAFAKRPPRRAQAACALPSPVAVEI